MDNPFEGADKDFLRGEPLKMAFEPAGMYMENRHVKKPKRQDRLRGVLRE